MESSDFATLLLDTQQELLHAPVCIHVATATDIQQECRRQNLVAKYLQALKLLCTGLAIRNADSASSGVHTWQSMMGLRLRTGRSNRGWCTISGLATTHEGLSLNATPFLGSNGLILPL
jgi:hypothetical protein